MLVYNTATAGTVPNNVTPGYYYWDGAKWVKFMVNNNNTIDLGYILGWTSNTAPPDYLLPLNGGVYNWADYPDFQAFHASYPCQFIASSTGTTFTLVDINTSGRFLRGNTGAGVLQNGSTALPTTAFTTNTTGAHTHSVDPPSTTTSSNGDHNHLEGTHSEPGTNFNVYGQTTSDANGWRTNHTYNKYRQNYTSTTGAHTHTLNIPAFNSASAGDHSHTISGGDVETRPINTSVIWCIKVKPTATSGDITIVNTANTAINGLSVYGTAVGLGGNLNQNTIISNLSATNKLNFIGSGVNMFNVDGTTFSVDGDNDRVGIGTTTPTAKLQVGVGNNDGIMIGNYNDGLSWNGTGTEPEYAIRFTGYRDVVSNFTGAKIAAKRTNICCSGLSQGTYLSFQTQSTTASVGGDGNLIEQMKITDKVTINSLAGTGNRPVYADASGTLNTDKNYVYNSVNTESGGLTTGEYQIISSGLITVETGTLVKIEATASMKFTGGSGADRWIVRLYVAACGGSDVEISNVKTSYVPNGQRDVYFYTPLVDMWTATCNGNVEFKIKIERMDADDTWKYQHARILVTKL